jgi:hypothetical protein
MVGRNIALSGIYRLKAQAERALDTLIAGGVPCSSISVLLIDSADADGNAIGGTIGVLGGAAVVTVPGIGRMIAAGPITAGLADAAIDLARALIGTGVPELDAKYYEAEVKRGATLISLSCNCIEQISRARQLLTFTGATALTIDLERTVT